MPYKSGFRKFRRSTQIAHDHWSRNKRNNYNYRKGWELICVLMIRITQCYSNYITCIGSVSASRCATYSFREHISLTTIGRPPLIWNGQTTRVACVIFYFKPPCPFITFEITCGEKMNACPGRNDQIDRCPSRSLNKSLLFYLNGGGGLFIIIRAVPSTCNCPCWPFSV